MQKQQYEDFKYIMQDTYQMYLGAKYTFEEVVDNEEIPFKFRLIVERYVYPEINPETTLESHFYYLSGNGLLVKTYKHIKLKVKFNMLEEKKGLTGKAKKVYTTQIVPITEFVKMTPEEKEAKGVVIQEIICSKLSLMAF